MGGHTLTPYVSLLPPIRFYYDCYRILAGQPLRNTSAQRFGREWKRVYGKQMQTKLLLNTV